MLTEVDTGGRLDDGDIDRRRGGCEQVADPCRGAVTALAAVGDHDHTGRRTDAAHVVDPELVPPA